ncbi:hypothetical protein EW146_g530, partial [Bondarzewia mesenterica]
MPGPQSPYSHPGPSTYYHQPPPIPPYAYPVNGHAPAPYPYPYPQNMSGHAHVQPPSPRIVPGPGRGGYHGPSRGGPGPSYQNYHSPHPHAPQHPQFLHPPHIQMHSPQPSPATQYQHHQSQKYPPHPQQVPYSPSYHPVQPATAYQQNWPLQHPISPLPKQLSMPPPPPLSPLAMPIHPSPRQEEPPPASLDVSMESEPTPSSPSSPELLLNGHGEGVSESTHSRSPSPTADSHVSPRAQSPASVSASASSTSNAKPSFGGWVIWSRRPSDPARAPGIIISPRACPTQDVIEKALLLSTPPVSPSPSAPPSPKVLPAILTAPVSVHTGTEVSPDQIERPDVPSSSATETTPACSTAPDTPMPGSPVSTNTSISVAGGKAVLKSPVLPEARIARIAEAETPATEPSSPKPAEPILAVDLIPQPEASTSALPTPAPTPASAAPKKSWASLLRPTGGSGARTAAKTANALPTSSIVGFSVPASPPPSRVVPARRTELCNVLSGVAYPSNSGAPRIRPRGLVNSGNMCFANAVLQLLVYSPPFWRLFTELGKLLPEGNEGRRNEEGQTPLVDATIKFLKEFAPLEKTVPGNGKGKSNGKGKEVSLDDEEENSLESFIPTFVYDAMKEKKRFDNMRGGQQEDAEEFLGFYLDALEEELLFLLATLNPSKAAAPSKEVEEREEEPPREDGWLEVGKRNKMVVTRTVKSTESPITRIFGGKFRSTLRAPHQRDSVVVEDWRSLQLDIQRETVLTIRDALSHISEPQTIHMDSPTHPGLTIEASQQVVIEALPPILVLHLKRFLYDVDAKGVVKIGKMIQFSPELEISKDIMAPGRKSAHPVRYQLYGVLYHHGLSASGGHYTLDVLHPNRDLSAKPREAWIRIDDELVSDVRAEDVFDGLDRDDRLTGRHTNCGPWSTRVMLTARHHTHSLVGFGSRYCSFPLFLSELQDERDIADSGQLGLARDLSLLRALQCGGFAEVEEKGVRHSTALETLGWLCQLFVRAAEGEEVAMAYGVGPGRVTLYVAKDGEGDGDEDQEVVKRLLEILRAWFRGDGDGEEGIVEALRRLALSVGARRVSRKVGLLAGACSGVGGVGRWLG